MNTWTVTGTLASVAGVGIGVWTLMTARSAREAARQAGRKARERGLVEELEATQARAQQVGILLMSQSWVGAHLRATDVQNACRAAAVRWLELSEASRNALITAAELAHSIASAAQELQIKPDQLKKLKAAADAQLRTGGLISEALAEARKIMERRSA